MGDAPSPRPTAGMQDRPHALPPPASPRPTPPSYTHRSTLHHIRTRYRIPAHTFHPPNHPPARHCNSIRFPPRHRLSSWGCPCRCWLTSARRQSSRRSSKTTLVRARPPALPRPAPPQPTPWLAPSPPPPHAHRSPDAPLRSSPPACDIAATAWPSAAVAPISHPCFLLFVERPNCPLSQRSRKGHFVLGPHMSPKCPTTRPPPNHHQPPPPPHIQHDH